MCLNPNRINSYDNEVVFKSLSLKIFSIKNHIDIKSDRDTLNNRTAILLFWGVVTSYTSALHNALKICNPRFNGRGDNSVYNRSLLRLKAIMTVLCGFTNSPITKARIKFSIFHTNLVDHINWSLAAFARYRPICFNLRRS